MTYYFDRKTGVLVDRFDDFERRYFCKLLENESKLVSRLGHLLDMYQEKYDNREKETYCEKTTPNLVIAAFHDNVFISVFWGMG